MSLIENGFALNANIHLRVSEVIQSCRKVTHAHSAKLSIKSDFVQEKEHFLQKRSENLERDQ